MRSNFSTTERILAFPAAMMTPENVTELVTLYGDDLPETPNKPDSPTRRVIMGGFDGTCLQAQWLSLEELGIMLTPEQRSDWANRFTCSSTPLTDGRKAIKGYWSLAFEAAMAAHPLLADADWITDEQLAELRYQPEFEL